MPEEPVVQNGRPDKDIHDRICDMVMFSLAGGMITGLAYMQALQAEQTATLASVLVGAVAMYLKGK